MSSCREIVPGILCGAMGEPRRAQEGGFKSFLAGKDVIILGNHAR